MIYFTAHTFKCVCHCRRAMFRVLGMYNFGFEINCRVHGQLKRFEIFTGKILKVTKIQQIV